MTVDLTAFIRARCADEMSALEREVPRLLRALGSGRLSYAQMGSCPMEARTLQFCEDHDLVVYRHDGFCSGFELTEAGMGAVAEVAGAP